MKSEGIQTLFQPTFGNRQEQYIGRDGVIDQFMAGLRELCPLADSRI